VSNTRALGVVTHDNTPSAVEIAHINLTFFNIEPQIPQQTGNTRDVGRKREREIEPLKCSPAT